MPSLHLRQRRALSLRPSIRAPPLRPSIFRWVPSPEIAHVASPALKRSPVSWMAITAAHHDVRQDQSWLGLRGRTSSTIRAVFMLHRPVAVGSGSVRIDPVPGVLSALMSPPIIRARRRAMARPSAVPP